MTTRSVVKQEPLSRWPLYELIEYGRQLGLEVSDDIPRRELVTAIRARQELILELDETALLEIAQWAGQRTSQQDSKETLAKKIIGVRKMRFGELSDGGLQALARLRAVEVRPGAGRDEIITRLKKSESFWNKVVRKKRRIVASWLAKSLVSQADEEVADTVGRKEQISKFKDSLEDEGVVGGLAGKIKTVADGYVAEKLDEIEQRIDQKLDEIDRRLAEWRDREVATRLRIIKITVAASVLVALLSLGYTVVKRQVLSDGADGRSGADTSQRVDESEAAK